MKHENIALLQLLQENCSRGKAVINPNAGIDQIDICIFAPKNEQDGLRKKTYEASPFKELQCFYSIYIFDLSFYECRFSTYKVYINNDRCF